MAIWKWDLQGGENLKKNTMRFARGRESQEKWKEICKGERISEMATVCEMKWKEKKGREKKSGHMH